MIVLVDQDGVLADFEHRFHQLWTATHPDAVAVAVADRRTFYVADQLPAPWRPAAADLVSGRGFYASLPPVPGAVAGIESLTAAGHDVWICTSPLTAYEHCVPEKYRWVAEHLGRAWTKRMIVVKDKTLVHGDVLIDDRPEVVGTRTPTWRHLVFGAPYNRGSASPRVSWTDLAALGSTG